MSLADYEPVIHAEIFASKCNEIKLLPLFQQAAFLSGVEHIFEANQKYGAY